MTNASTITILQLAARNVDKMLTKQLRQIDLTPNAMRALLEIEATAAGLPAADIRRRLGLNKNTVIYCMRDLELKGLIARPRGERSGTLNNMITEKGAEVVALGKVLLKEIDAEISKAVGQTGSAAFAKKLGRIAEIGAQADAGEADGQAD